MKTRVKTVARYAQEFRSHKELGVRYHPGFNRDPAVDFKSNFPKGHKFSTKDYMSPESHSKRVLGYLKGLAARHRRVFEGDTTMPARKKILFLRQRAKVKRDKLRLTTAKEAREIQNKARTMADAAMDKLGSILNDPLAPAPAQIAAAQVILDRAYGKASQTNINASVDANGKANEITQKELDKRTDDARREVEDVLRKLERITGRTAASKPRKERLKILRVSDRDPDDTTIH